jgi:hypothetical protein
MNAYRRRARVHAGEYPADVVVICSPCLLLVSAFTGVMVFASVHRLIEFAPPPVAAGVLDVATSPQHFGV